MKIEDFIECTIDELLAKKRNSFSRNIVMQNSDIERHEELTRLMQQGSNGELAVYLFVCPNLTIHAIDEKEAPVSFDVLDRIYRNYVFILQYLKRKNAFVLTMFKNDKLTDKENFTRFFNKTYFSSLQNKALNTYESFLDFGLVKCAMSIRKDYGIQDLLEIAFRMFDGDSSVWTKYSSVRYVFNIEHPELSTWTLFSDEDLNVYGKTKIISKNVNQIKAAINSLLQRKYVQDIVEN